MKLLIIACSLLLSSALFAQDSVGTKLSDVQVQISTDSADKNNDVLYTNFGTIPVGSLAYTTYYVTNIGDQPLFFRNARIAGPGFYARTDCNRVLPPRGGRCTFTIEFRPYYEGYSSGQFMMSFDPDYSVIVQLAGQAYRY